MDSNLSQSNNITNSKNLQIANDPNDFGILLISHGSSLPYAEKTFKEILEKYIAKTGHNAEVGYMKVSNPSISEAISNLLSRNNNIKRIIAMPVFLAPGIHTNIDIPIILGINPLEIDPRCPDGNYSNDHYLNQSKPVEFSGKIDLMDCIGADPSIIHIINSRISSAIEKSDKNISPDKTAILLVSHGSRLNYNRDFITEVYNQYKNQSNYLVGQGFMELCEPTIAQAIYSMTEKKEFERLVVVPVFLAPGVHTTRDIPTILGLLEDNKIDHGEHSHFHSHNHDPSHSHSHDHAHGDNINFDGEILYCEPLGSDNIIIDIIEKRIRDKINE
jgi:sirohydrochlorin ferrochelatase